LAPYLPARAGWAAGAGDFVGGAVPLQSAAEGDVDLLRVDLGMGGGDPVLRALRIPDHFDIAGDAGQA